MLYRNVLPQQSTELILSGHDRCRTGLSLRSKTRKENRKRREGAFKGTGKGKGEKNFNRVSGRVG